MALVLLLCRIKVVVSVLDPLRFTDWASNVTVVPCKVRRRLPFHLFIV